MNIQHVIKLNHRIHTIKAVYPTAIQTTSGILFYPASNKLVIRQNSTGQMRSITIK